MINKNEYYQYRNNAVYKIIKIKNNKIYLENIDRKTGESKNQLTLDLDFFITQINTKNFKKVEYLNWI